MPVENLLLEKLKRWNQKGIDKLAYLLLIDELVRYDDVFTNSNKFTSKEPVKYVRDNVLYDTVERVKSIQKEKNNSRYRDVKVSFLKENQDTNLTNLGESHKRTSLSDNTLRDIFYSADPEKKAFKSGAKVESKLNPISIFLGYDNGWRGFKETRGDDIEKIILDKRNIEGLGVNEVIKERILKFAGGIENNDSKFAVFWEEQPYSSSDLITILFLPLNQFQGKANEEVQFILRQRYIRLQELNNFPITVDTADQMEGKISSFAEARKIGKENGADIVLWGNIFSKEDKIDLCYAIVDKSLPVPHNSGSTGPQKYELSRLSEGEFQGNIDYLLFWLLGYREYIRDNFEEALSYFKQIENADDDVNFRIGYCYHRLDELNQAKTYYEKVITCESKDQVYFKALLNMMDIDLEFLEEGRTDYEDELKHCLEKSSSMKEPEMRSHAGYFNWELGNYYRRNKKTKEAVEYYFKSIPLLGSESESDIYHEVIAEFLEKNQKTPAVSHVIKLNKDLLREVHIYAPFLRK